MPEVVRVHNEVFRAAAAKTSVAQKRLGCCAISSFWRRWFQDFSGASVRQLLGFAGVYGDGFKPHTWQEECILWY